MRFSNLSGKPRQVTLRSLTTFIKRLRRLGERWAIAQTYLRDSVPQTPFFASRLQFVSIRKNYGFNLLSGRIISVE